MRAIVSEAHRLDRKVAAHAIGSDGIAAALAAGVDSIEHGDGLDEEIDRHSWSEKGVYWCPTIYVGVYVAEGRAAAGAAVWKTMVDLERKAFGLAVKKGVKIAYGTDAGGYAWTENQAKELDYMVKYGMTPDAGHPVGDHRRGRAAPGRGRTWAPSSRAGSPTSSPWAAIRSPTSRNCSGSSS